MIIEYKNKKGIHHKTNDMIKTDAEKYKKYLKERGFEIISSNEK